MMIFEKGQKYENEYSNVFIKNVYNGVVSFIDGFSPSAIHDMQELDSEDLEVYLTEYNFILNGSY